MGNKSTSPHLTKTYSLTGHEKSRFIEQHALSNNDDSDYSLNNSAYPGHYTKKCAPSPRFRRRHSKQTQFDKKTKKLQPVSSYLNVSLQSIGDRTISLFSRSFHFLQQSPSSQSKNNRFNSSTNKNNQGEYNVRLQSGVYRNQSRRKYQTSSLRNPYRRSSTNFPVRGHEAVFLPEFAIKGKITEADFEVIDIIARGAFGNVIKVCSINDRKIYAMKIMSKSQIVKDNAVQQVKDEVTIAQSCHSHPFIVHTYCYWQSRRYLYIITDYVQNGELLSLWLRIRRFPELVVKIYIAQVAMVLEYLHNKGIIYRDVKMENILLDDKGNIQIIDFGLSKWLPMGQRTTTICGTLQYIAPEVLSVRPYDHRVDWWSLGILMYACLFGEYPVSATKDHLSMANKVLNHKFNVPLDELENKTDVKELLYNLLEKNPNNRLCSLEKLRQNPFMSNVSFDSIYSKYYSPLSILMNAKVEWHDELKQHYQFCKKPRSSLNANGYYSPRSCQQQNQYENINNVLCSE